MVEDKTTNTQYKAMKFKTLRRKDGFKEFASLNEFGEMCTHEHPTPLGNEVTLEALKEYCNSEELDEGIDWDNYEIVEIEYYEAGVIGADIRNKLTPPLNLIALLEIYFKDNVAHASEERANLYRLIKKEMENVKKCVNYIANLL